VTDKARLREALERGTLCLECGPGAADEDGLCVSCGATAVGPWAEKACAALLESEPGEAEVWLPEEARKDLERLVAMARAWDPQDADGYIRSCESTVRAALRAAAGPDAETRRKAWGEFRGVEEIDWKETGCVSEADWREACARIRAGLYPEETT